MERELDLPPRACGFSFQVGLLYSRARELTSTGSVNSRMYKWTVCKMLAEPGTGWEHLLNTYIVNINYDWPVGAAPV